MTETDPVLIIGVGKIGGPIARRLARAGVPIHAFDVNTAALASVCRDGITPVGPEVVYRLGYRRVLLCLPDPQAVEAFVARLIETRAATDVVIADLTTVPPALARSLAFDLGHVGVSYLDTPVSGGERGAKTGSMVVMGSGNREAFARIEPLLRVIGSAVHYVGDSGRASLLKAVNQYVYLAYNFALAQGLRIGRELELPEEALFETLTRGAPAHPLINDRIPEVLSTAFERGFPIRRCVKDLDCLELPSGFTSSALDCYYLIHEALSRAAAAGAGGLDILALGEVELPSPDKSTA
jgi:3-hydroxyisobutyrate dehydrogenase-like beta-hydroxyacid dehydrogenase